jgi:hypothetical protein
MRLCRGIFTKIKMPVILGLKSAMSKFQAREKLAQKITRTSGRSPKTVS